MLEVKGNTLKIRYNISINKTKTKILVMSKHNTHADIHLGGKQSDNMNKFVYVGNNI